MKHHLSGRYRTGPHCPVPEAGTAGGCGRSPHHGTLPVQL